MTRKRRDVQGLRALAILMVVAYHGRFGVRGGFAGVDVFFVISGFVITGTLVRELEERGRLSIPAFYARRAKRLLPGLATMLTFVAVAGMLLAPIAAVHMSALTGMAASVFGANWYLYSLPSGYFDPSVSLDPLLHTWTLGVEEQFYLIFPLLLWGAWRLGRRVGAAAAMSLAFALSLVLALSWSSAHPQLAFYGSPARAWEFALGCLIALGAPIWTRTPRLLGAAFAAFGLVGVIAAMPGGDGSIVQNQAPAAVGVGLLIIAGFASSGPNIVSSTLGMRPLVWIGDRSYSWYLWHWPLIVFAGALWPGSTNAARVAAVVSLPVAAGSYVWIENPVRYSPIYVGRRLAYLTATLIALPVMAGLLQLRVSFVSSVAYAAGEPHADLRRHCDQADPLGSPTRRQCNWDTPRARGRIVLIGDSNAGQYTEPVTAAGNELGYDVTVATFSDCPFIPLRLIDSIGSGPACERFGGLSLRTLLRHPPSLVIIGMRADFWINGTVNRIGLPGSRPSSNPQVKELLWSRALRTELVALTRAGIPAVVIEPLPYGPVDDTSCAVIRLLVSNCDAEIQSRVRVDRELGPAVSAEQAAVKGLSRVRLLDLEGQLCSVSSCRMTVHQIAMYRDPSHLSIAGAQLMTPVFAQVIATTV